MPTSTSKTTAVKRAAAARAERNGKVKHADFRGLTLDLPAKCPGEVLFDIGEDNISSTLRTLLGDTQYGQLRTKVAEEKLSLTETVTALTELLNEIFSDAYGITSGE